MAKVKISELPSLSPATLDTTYVVGILGSTTYKISINQLTSSLDTTFATDLVTAALSSSLNSKLSTSSYSTDSASFNSRIISGSVVAGTISGSAQISDLGFVTGSYTTLNSFNNLTQSFNSISQSFTTISGSFGDIDFSGINAVTESYLLFTQSYYSASASVDNRITNEKNRIDAILSASNANSDTFAEVVSLINSVDLTNDNAFATFYTASNGRLTSLENSTGSFLTSLDGAVSSSSQLTSSYDERYVLSGSITQTTWDNIENKPNDIVSSSQQIEDLGFITGSYATINQYNSLTQSINVISGSVVNLTNTIDTGSYATTGSNTFNGNQTINGSIILDNGSIIKDNVNSSIAFGLNAGDTNQGTQSVALGASAGQYDQSNGSVAVGALAGGINQGQRAVALGTLAGSNTQGEYAIAIGNFAAPNNQASHSIVISAMGSGLDNTTPNSLKIEPIRNTTGSDGILQYNNTTKEVSYSNDISNFVGNLVTTSSFNEYTASQSTASLVVSIDALNSATSSYLTSLDGTISGSSQLTSSFDSRYMLSGSSVSINTGSFATTGSNTFNGNQIISGSVTATGNLISNNSTGDEGGEINLALAQTNNTLTGSNLVIDVFQSRLRIFEGGGDSRGVSIDMSKTPTGVGGELMWKASGFVAVGTFVSLDNIKCTITASGQRGLSIAAVSTTFEADLGGYFTNASGVGGGSANNVTYTTTASNSIFGWNFAGHGDTVQVNLRDKTNNRFYRITMMIGVSYISNFISIERLH